MKETMRHRLKPVLLAATLMTAFVVGIAPTASAECGDLDDRCTYPTATEGALGTLDCAGLDPGDDAGDGAAEVTIWAVEKNVFLACGLVDSVEDSILLHGGDVVWKMGVAASGGAELFDTSDLVPSALVYVTEASDVAGSQAYDTCANLLSPGVCGSDSDVPQDLNCPGGASIPNPLGPGGLAGDTLDNMNGALQATCILVGSTSTTVPNATQVTDYLDDVQMILVEINGDVFAFASDVQDVACIYATGETPCF